MTTDELHDHAHLLLIQARDADDRSDNEEATRLAREALDAFWALHNTDDFLEPCDGIAQTNSLLGFLHEDADEHEGSHFYREANFNLFIGDGDGDEILALMDMARAHAAKGDLISRRLCWLAAADLLQREFEDGDEQKGHLVAFCREQADLHGHEHLTFDWDDALEE